MITTAPAITTTLEDAWNRANAFLSHNHNETDESKVFRKIMSNWDILAIEPYNLARLIVEVIAEAAYAPMYFGHTGLVDAEINYFVYRYMTGWRHK